MSSSTTFDQLQRRLLQRLAHTTPEAGASTIVVCPSITFPPEELRKIVGIQYYEERLLFLTLLLRDPALHIVYPTSVPVDATIVDYYLSLLPDPSDARRRLHLFAVGDDEPVALTGKLLARPDLVAEMKSLVADPETSYIFPFNVTEAEATLAVRLGLPIYGPHPDLVWLGSKSGARKVAIEAGVDVFDGAGDLHSLKDLEAAIERLRRSGSHRDAVVAKLNNGFSGQGNVILELGQVRSPLQSSPAVFCASEESWATFGPKVEAEGAIVEELARDPGTVSPSVQVRVLPGGRSEVISTHDQILGGPDDQVYLGCRFPAHPEYRQRIAQEAMKVAAVLAGRGVIGSFGIDFVVVPGDGVYLSEINLRLGGTTHPFLMARYVTGGMYDEDAGGLATAAGLRVYMASDNIKSPRYVGLTPARVIGAVSAAGLAYDHDTRTGATLHLLGALHDYGKWGLVCLARSHDDAERLYDDVVACVDEIT